MNSTTYTSAIVSQPNKCLKFMTFREGCFVIRNWVQVLNWSSSDFLSSLILQKMKEDNISQLWRPFCEQQYRHGSCDISLFKFESFDQFKIIKIGQAVLEIFNFKDRDLGNFTRKNDRKTENVVFLEVLHKLKNNRLCDVRNHKCTYQQ